MFHKVTVIWIILILIQIIQLACILLGIIHIFILGRRLIFLYFLFNWSSIFLGLALSYLCSRAVDLLLALLILLLNFFLLKLLLHSLLLIALVRYWQTFFKFIVFIAVFTISIVWFIITHFLNFNRPLAFSQWLRCTMLTLLASWELRWSIRISYPSHSRTTYAAGGLLKFIRAISIETLWSRNDIRNIFHNKIISLRLDTLLDLRDRQRWNYHIVNLLLFSGRWLIFLLARCWSLSGLRLLNFVLPLNWPSHFSPSSPLGLHSHSLYFWNLFLHLFKLIQDLFHVLILNLLIIGYIFFFNWVCNFIIDLSFLILLKQPLLFEDVLHHLALVVCVN